MNAFIRTFKHLFLLTSALLLALGTISWGQVPTTLDDFFLPGSQPNQSGQLETPQKCDNCHGGYDQAVEPAFNWRGSMMAQAAHDPLFFACLAIANQDAPDSGDLCIRCHSPAGWLEGRSVPTDGSALNNNDREGVQCDFCHKLVKPAGPGENPYWQDTAYTSDTYPRDQDYLASLSPRPAHSANGMYIADSSNAKRGPFVDASAKHQMFYSPFHHDADLCATCHDVSNPVYMKNGGTYVPNNFGEPSPDFDPHTMFPIERTFSEWSVSDYNTPSGVYAPQFGGNEPYVSTCQDCHMRDVTGVACNKRGAVRRTDLPLHDLTGGNTFIPNLLPALFPDEVSSAALNAGVQRAKAMLQNAATMDVSVLPASGSGYDVTVRVTNETAHKLPSGYPEGRRIWLNVKAVDAGGATIYESGAYDFETAVLTHDANAKIYEIKPGISADVAPVLGLPSGPSFHFVLNNQIFKDNRIPPRGFTNANFAAIQSPPVAYSYTDGQYWDDTFYTIPANSAEVTVTLYYQTLSKEYVEFLRDENTTNHWGQTLYDLWNTNGKSTPVVMASDTTTIQQTGDTEPPTVPSNLAATAISSSQIDLMWNPSTDNVGVAGYAVYRNGAQVGTTTGTSYPDTGLQPSTTYSYYVTAFDVAGNMSPASNTATATTQPAVNDTEPPTAPTSLQANAISHREIDLAWSASSDNVGVAGYNVFRNGALVGTTATTSYADKGLDASTTYSYYVTAFDAAGNESSESNTAQATTLNRGKK